MLSLACMVTLSNYFSKLQKCTYYFTRFQASAFTIDLLRSGCSHYGGWAKCFICQSQVKATITPAKSHSTEQIPTRPSSASAWLIFAELRLGNGDWLDWFTQTEMAMKGVQLPLQYCSWKKLVVKDNCHLKKTTTAKLWKHCSVYWLAWVARTRGSNPREYTPLSLQAP